MIASIIVGLVATAVLGEFAFRQFVSPRIRHIFENVPPFNVIPEPECPQATRVSFRTSDNILLRGSLLNGDVENPAGLILFLPELRGNHWMARRYCHALIENGFVVLAFDFRNQGDSESQEGYTPIHWMTEYEMSDVQAALEFIETDSRLSTLPIVAFGVSRGGVAALMAGCRYPRICGVIADSAFGTMAMTRFFVDRFVRHVIPGWVYRLLPQWHVELTLRQAVQLSEVHRSCRYVHLEKEAVGLDSSSVLLISGARDSYVTPEIAERLREITGPESELWIASGAKHNMSRNAQPAEYDRRVLEHALKCTQEISKADTRKCSVPLFSDCRNSDRVA